MTDTRSCNLCGIRTAGGREHLPGVGAGNTGPVRIAYFAPTAARQERLERKGFVVHTLCTHCNSRTGGHYGTAYKDFVEQFGKSGVLDAGYGRTWVTLRDVQPLRVIKQMTSMFIAAQGEFPRDRWLNACDFVLDRDAKLRDVPLRYYIYRNVGAVGRVTAMTSLMSANGRWPPIFFCEVSWPPLGIVFVYQESTDLHPLLAGMQDVTSWGEYGFRDRANLSFSVSQRRVATHWPLGFGDDREAHDWSARDGVVTLVGPHVGDDEAAQVSVLTRRSR
jgi:hypothetical protein